MARIPGFYKLDVPGRRRALQQALGLDDDWAGAFDADALPQSVADLMIENVVGTLALPVGVGLNLTINGREYAVPMVVEEPSVVAAVCNMARLVREAGGFQASADPSVMVGQVLITTDGPMAPVAERLEAFLPALSAEATAWIEPRLGPYGGRFEGAQVRSLLYDEPGHPPQELLVLHVLVDVADAMGANVINSLAEHLAPSIETAIGGRVRMSILSNLADRRLARASCALPGHLFDDDRRGVRGSDVTEGIQTAWRFAWADPYRAATHNKGIMNGIDPVAIATGNDWRAIEAGAHAYAARSGHYRPLTRWTVDAESVLHGSIELPMQVGVVGGPIKVHPTVQACHRLLGLRGAAELAMVLATVGLVQNLGALRALVTEGIQDGHMRMHARSVAATAGVPPELVPAVAERLAQLKDFSVDRARAILAELQGG